MTRLWLLIDLRNACGLARPAFAGLAIALVLAVAAPRATAQPVTAEQDVPLEPVPFDASSCAGDAVRTPVDSSAPPVTWNDFEILGPLRDGDDAATVRSLFAPAMARWSSLTETARADIARIAKAFGYELVALGPRATPTGTHAVLRVAPLPLIRKVQIHPFDSKLDDEVRRRVRLRVGTYLPWSMHDRECALHDEQTRIYEYLRDEGYPDAKVTITPEVDGDAVRLHLKVSSGEAYVAGQITIADPDKLHIAQAEIRAKFDHPCTILKLCFGSRRFTRADHQADLQKVVDLFRTRGYPAVRVQSSYDPKTSFDRRTHSVRFTVTIDPRRLLDVQFIGNDDSVSDDDLRKQLKFAEDGSSDDVEAVLSASGITNYLQGRGFFDAHVTWSRERYTDFDKVIYRIDQGPERETQSVTFVGNAAIKSSTLADAIGTHEATFSSSLLGANTAPTSEQLEADRKRIVDVYRRAGYLDAEVRVSASTDPIALDSAALTAALVSAERGSGIFVRFTIAEHEPTLLSELHVELGAAGDAISGADQQALCDVVLHDIAEIYADQQLAKPAVPGRCFARAAKLAYREDDATGVKDQLKDRLFSHGRPRAEVAFTADPLGPHLIAARYVLTNTEPLKIGKVVIRGNFKTRDDVISSQLGLIPGQPLTSDAVADGARKLRNTALFDAVNVELVDLDNTTRGAVNVVVKVQERYDFLGTVDIETGYSSYNGVFFKLIPSFKNLFGTGISLDLTGTIGFDLVKYADTGELDLRQLAAEATLRFPQWLPGQWLHSPIDFQTELTAFERRQDTPEFGLLTTDGVTIGLSRTWQRQRTKTQSANARTVGIHYDFRLRDRNVDVLRPLGADDDQTQVPISTRTGSVGVAFEWEQRTDRNGALSPLAPETGFHFDAQVAYAFELPVIGGQDTFLKVSAAGSKYWSVGSNFVLRGDLRYDQGFPLGGAVLLPEVERFFAGGDATVRGYDDDRMATQIIQVGVPPIGNLTQIRILPAGGNIRVIGSLDAQLRIWKVFATAAFLDAGMITNEWSTVTTDSIKPAVGLALVRLVTPFGALAIERALPLRPQLGDDPRGRWHFSFAARAQF